ncbi:MAG: FKBP-type peptidyl-prolyl cis-trans isomerase [Bacteroidales bacterium]|nr:FKBP-type peptidyl-prolyl cis-trans isomerase [Bacteroidales bacterium]
MKKSLFFILAGAAVSALLASCAVAPVDDSVTQQKSVRDAWVRVNYGTDYVALTESGIYILEETPGTGPAVKDSTYCFVHYSTRELDGTYLTTSDPEIAKRNLGTYTDTLYWCPEIWRIADYTENDGVRELLSTMKTGGKVKAIVAPELSSITYPKDYKLAVRTNIKEFKINTIYEISLEKTVNDIEQYEIDLLEAYADKYWSGLDSTARGYYFKKLKENPAEGDTIYDGASVEVFYSGHIIDGITDNFLFDTNIADTARIYRRFNKDNQYNALSVTFKKDPEESVSSNSLVDGFARAISEFKYGEEGVVFFHSAQGYKAEGSGTIPAYCPLVFYIRTADKK